VSPGISIERGIVAVRKLVGLKTYKVRFRVRVAKSLTTTDTDLNVIVLGRSVKISGQEKGEPLNTAKWLVFSASGFVSRRRARAFGDRLRNIVEVAGLAARLGVDVGQGQASSFVNEEWARSQGLLKPHERLSQNVHGVAVIEDDPNVKFAIVKAEATVTADPAQILDAITSLGKGRLVSLGDAASGLRIMNLSLMSPEPIAQMVLAFSAVEELGQTETWTYEQRVLLDAVASDVIDGRDASRLPADERAEVAEAIRRSTFRVGLGQGVVRILRRYGLAASVKNGIDSMGCEAASSTAHRV